MNSLTQDRVTRFDAWRNSTRKTHMPAVGRTGAQREPDSPASPGQCGLAPEVLARTVEREVIPRLMDVHRLQWQSDLHVANGHIPGHADVIAFARLVMSGEVAAALASIELKRGEGAALEELYLHLLLPAARHLSQLWEADLCHYQQIAVGMLHLQQVLRELSPLFSIEGECRAHGSKVLLLSAPGEQNMLGDFMVTEFHRCVVAEFFQRAGWEVWGSPSGSRPSLLAVVAAQWFDVIDVSASCEARLPMLADDLAAIRNASRNPRVRIMVGGQLFNEHPHLAGQVGADACAADPRASVGHAEMLRARRAG